MDQSAEITLAQWTAPQCPFTIEYSTRVLDEIRLAVLEAFHSLQRGGVEIGGLLLGRYENGRLTITETVPIECQHAFGPSFTLSEPDLSKLQTALAMRRSGESRTVGWYHSHTRSHVYLSDADQDIHRRFFPEPWQVAMVLKPHAFEPVRAGFFFYEADGAIHSTASYREFPIEPTAVRQMPRPPAPPPAAPQAKDSPLPTRRTPLFPGTVVDVAPVIDVSPVIEPEPPPPAPVLSAPPAPLAAPASPAPPARVVSISAAAPARETEAPRDIAPTPSPVEVEPPSFLVQPPVSRRWIALVAVLLGLAIGAAGFQTRERWLPRLREIAKQPAASGPASAPAPASVPAAAAAAVGLTAIDSDGQLLIRWNREAPELRKSTGALLVITDEGMTPQAIGLDAEHLLAGTFTYARRSGHVDVRLTIHHAEGRAIDEIATFLGAAPPPPAPGESVGARKQRDDEAVRLSKELERQAARTKQLEKTVDDMRKQIQKDQQRRMTNQSPESVKK